ncbi:MFS transporter [Streptacidiphilus sp. ASG 303]|uniref:MFS transporter n=1 Tax=Streptacidiphilus sp. ASG 303 TaxID=2896847 RepID=UPI001E4D99F0|nr:MFS transporter [Streptacidiphilus sp. ASG 303]MCD0485449.1 MFS transporter [Streptacidiphilus sp. ASG 303]
MTAPRTQPTPAAPATTGTRPIAAHPTPAAPATTAPALTDRGRWTALGVLVLGVLLVAVDATVLSLAVPFISEDLRPGGTQLLWIGDVYSFVLAGLLVSMGSLSDRLGRRRVLLWGAAGFGAASLAAAYAPGPGALIAARAVLGVAGAAIMPSTLSLIRVLFPDDRERATAIGVWGAAATAGAAAGPLLGGLLLEHFWWGSVFLVNLPVMALLLVLGARLLPESRDPRPGAWDLPSVALSLAGVVGTVYAVKEAAVHGPGRADVLAAGLAGAAALAVFVRRQLRLAVPLLDVRLFADRRFTAAVTAALVALVGLSGVVFFVSQYFQLVRGWSPLRAGIAELPAFGGAIAGGLLAGRLARRSGPRAALAGGLLLMGAGLGSLGWTGTGTPYPLLGAAFLAVGAAEGVVYTLATDLVLAAAPARKAGAASAVSETAYELGAALGIALIGSVLTGLYRAGVAVPAGVGGGAADRVRDSLGGAAEVAAGLPGPAAEAVMAAARQAFVEGMGTASLLAGALPAAAAAGAWLLLRRTGRPSAAERVGAQRAGVERAGVERHGREAAGVDRAATERPGGLTAAPAVGREADPADRCTVHRTAA